MKEMYEEECLKVTNTKFLFKNSLYFPLKFIFSYISVNLVMKDKQLFDLSSFSFKSTVVNAAFKAEGSLLLLLDWSTKKLSKINT